MRGRTIRLGRVTALPPTGHVVARIDDPSMRVRLGSTVVDSSGRIVGRLVDLIGNVERPYAVIKPSGGSEAPPMGEALFILVVPRRRSKGGRRRRERREPRARKKGPRAVKQRGKRRPPSRAKREHRGRGSRR